MQRQMTFRQYRIMDMCLFTALLYVCESLIVLAATLWFPGEPYTLSLTPAVAAIVMVRWGWMGIFPAIAGALALCICSGAAPVQYLIYLGGNLAALALAPVLQKTGGWQSLHRSVLRAMLYGMLSAVLMQAGRALIALALGSSLAVCAGFVTTDVLSTLFSVLLVWISRRLDGMLEAQPHYIRRIQKENEQNGEE